jgi:hypothetical protein
LTSLESFFSLIVVVNKEKQKEEELQMKVIETILLNIRTFELLTNVKIKVQCSSKEEMRYVELLGGFQNVFSWFNVGLRVFDPGLVHHIMKPSRKKQGLINSALKETFQKEMRGVLRTEMFSLVHHKWVSNWEPASKTIDNIRTYVSLRTFRQAIMRSTFPPLNMEMFLQ